MRLGGPVLEKTHSPDEWIAAVKQRGYRAAYCPLAEPDAALSAAYAKAAKQADIVIAEVGAWSNPISADATERGKAIELNQRKLALADEIGARCCVNIAGSRGPAWNGPHADNLSEDTFDLIVQTVRGIIDAVKPTRTFYTLETMQWVFPETADSYVRLIKAIDRPQFAAHLDPANLISSPQLFYKSGDLIGECFKKLGPYIKSCHAKDLSMTAEAGLHIYEVQPGLGEMDYRAFISELAKLDPDTPLMLEHLKTEAEYAAGAKYVRGVMSHKS